MKLFASVCFAAVIVLVSAALHAQDAGNASPRDPIAEQVLPPELIMQNQKAIGLSDTQKNALIAEIKKAQVRLIDLQWDMQRATERMVELLRQDKADEQAVVAQLDNLLATEREIKRIHIGLAVRLKNLLTPAQQKMLRELRAGQPPTK